MVSSEAIRLMRYPLAPTIVALDVDGVLNSSPIAKTASNLYTSWLLAQLPFFKKLAIEAVELSEVLFRVRYEVNDRMEILYNWEIPYMGIITDRSLVGLYTALQDRAYILERMSFVQVRKSLFGNSRNKSHCGPEEIWETKFVKPREDVLYNLANFAKKKDVPPYSVLLIDDDPLFRFVARTKFGFKTLPDDTEEEFEELYPLATTRLAPTQ